MRFAIGTKVYDMTAIEDLSLKMLLEVEAETARFGRKLCMADLRRMSTEIEALKTDQARADHPDSPWLTAVSIWATRRLSGEAIDFDTAIDFPMSQLVFMPEAHERGGTPAGPKGRKAAAAAGSGRGAAAARPSRAKPRQTKPTSATPSDAG